MLVTLILSQSEQHLCLSVSQHFIAASDSLKQPHARIGVWVGSCTTDILKSFYQTEFVSG